ncbi:MAG: protein kinase [Planctomycetaceae bacterium]|nr:protein kinase [Planctomycetaceae bacterium]
MPLVKPSVLGDVVPDEMGPLDTDQIIERLRKSDERAASLLFDRYVVRLTALARARLSSRLASRIDPEDVVMSAYRSFFVGARNGRFALDECEDFWPLLVTITLRKLYRQAAHHHAEMRDVRIEESSDETDPFTKALSRDPSPQEVVTVSDLLEDFLSTLDRNQRRVIELRLQGEEVDTIAEIIGKSERTVRRYLQQLQKEFCQRYGLSVSESEFTRSHEGPQDRVRRRLKSTDVVTHCYSDFLLEEMIGSGGMGKVYRASERPTGKSFALKFLRKNLLTEEDAVAAFLQEAEIVQRLDHPRIVGVHGLGQTPWGGYFIVMDLVEGQTLAQRHAPAEKQTQTIVNMMIAITEAVVYAHGKGVLHCDLKPHNILVDDQGCVRVTDFGLARIALDQTQQFTRLAGTAAFMAPEQVSDCWGAITPATDVWGLSAILCWLLTGNPPSTGDRVADVLAEIVSGRPVGALKLPIKVASPQLLDLCRRGLEKSQANRISTAATFLRELESLTD